MNDVERLEVSDEKNIAYVTQTTLSLDDTKDIVDALNVSFHHCISLEVVIFATQLKIGRTQLNNYLWKLKL